MSFSTSSNCTPTPRSGRGGDPSNNTNEGVAFVVETSCQRVSNKTNKTIPLNISWRSGQGCLAHAKYCGFRIQQRMVILDHKRKLGEGGYREIVNVTIDGDEHLSSNIMWVP